MIKKKIKANNVLWSLLLFVLLKPESIGYLSERLNYIWNLGRIAAIALVIVVSVLKINRIRKNPNIGSFMISIFLYIISLLIGAVTTANSNVEGCILDGLRVTAIFLLMQIVLCQGQNDLCAVSINVYEIYIIINFLTILLYPNGMYKNEWGYVSNYFLGAKNVFILYILPFVFFVLIRFQNKSCLVERIKGWVVMFIGLASVLIVWSASSIIVIAMAMIWFFASDFFCKHDRVFNIRNFIIICLLLFVIIVIYQNLDAFSWLVEKVLHKDITLTARYDIWNSILIAIAKKPLFGYGILDGTSIIMVTNNVLGINSHNMYLWCMFRGGIINLASLLMMIFIATNELLKFKTDKIVSGVSWIIFCLMISWMTEVHSLIYMLPIIIAGGCISRLSTSLVESGNSRKVRLSKKHW